MNALRLLSIATFAALVICVPSEMFAQAPAPSTSVPSLVPATGGWVNCNFVTGDFRASCFPEYIQYLIRVIYMFIGAFFLLMLIIGGYQIAIGSVTGNKDAGKERVKFAILGFILAAFSYLIIDFVVLSIITGP